MDVQDGVDERKDEKRKEVFLWGEHDLASQGWPVRPAGIVSLFHSLEKIEVGGRLVG